MKPLKSLTQDDAALIEIGRASIQIVHDLKNQLNGLKLYATFLRKRMEKGGRPDDELETIGKLIAGLERAAGDMTTLVRLSRPLEVRRQQTDLSKIVSETGAGEGISTEVDIDSLVGEFDAGALAEAFKTITTNALARRDPDNSAGVLIHLRSAQDQALVEWHGLKIGPDDDLFHSLAGGEGIRMSLAAKSIEAHGGAVEHDDRSLRVRLPLTAQKQSAVGNQQSASGD